jgi:hypothetical protein
VIRAAVIDHKLVLIANNEGRAALAENYRLKRGYRGAEGIVAEALHEQFEFVVLEYISGALTDAPILVACDDLGYPDNGECVITPSAPIFWFPNYMVEDPFETLKNRGRVAFDQAEPYEWKPTAPMLPLDLERYLPGGDKQGFAFLINEGVERYDYPKFRDVPAMQGPYNEPDDGIFPGVYFFDRNGKLHGPYSTGAVGILHLERDGGRIEWREREHSPTTR